MKDEEKTTTKHPSFGMISYGRHSHGIGSTLFGSSIKTDTTMCIEITHADITRDLSHDWYMPRGIIARVYLTPNQFAEFLTNGNTTGVPCTIDYTEKDGSIEPMELEGKRQLFEKEFEEDLAGIRKDAKEFKNKVDSIMKKQNILKADKEELMGLAFKIEQDIRANLPFVQTSFNKSMDKTVTEAKAEFEAAIEHKVYTLGLQELRKNIATQLLPEGKVEYKLWDTIQKNYFNDREGKNLVWINEKEADDYRIHWFNSGNYPDRPITVVTKHKFINGKFVEEIQF